MTLLIDNGLMPADMQARKALEHLDPYRLRADALDQRLEAHELGRALFHLNQRRGFKSNRIADSDDSDKSATRDGMRHLKRALDDCGARTLGEFLASQHQRDRFGRRVSQDGKTAVPQSVRFRPSTTGSKNLWDFYPSRDLIADELVKIWNAQRTYHHCLTTELFNKLERLIVNQRPLKKPLVGRCTLRPELQLVRQHGLELDLGERAPKAHPSFQRFRILQDVAQLRIMRPGVHERPLSLQERDMIAACLMERSGSTIPFEKLRSAAKLPEDARFNYELAGRSGLQSDQTAAKLGSRKAFGKLWRALSRERQIEVVERMLAVEESDVLETWLCREHGLNKAESEAVSGMRLPQGHGAFGRGVLTDLVVVMERESRQAMDPDTGEVYDRSLTYDEATATLDFHHSDLRPTEKSARLPYYGKALVRHVIPKPDAPEGSQESIGRVPNPTVHIGLNQVRGLINALIDEYGAPKTIAVELARELKLNKTRKNQIQRENRENERKNNERRERLTSLGVADTHDARLRLRLFDELPASERVCVFTGAPLSIERLYDGSTEIEHILPHSRTLDDNFMNKVLCTREANRNKANRAPAEVWSGDDLQEIVERAERLFPKKKAWRFQPDAMRRFEVEGGFLARHLIDSQHMARLAKTYLEHVCDDVRVSPGRLTAMLRAKWGLNSLLPDHNFADANQPKNRRDHRHHVIDAFVVACTDLGLLNRIARESGRAEALNLDRLFPHDSFPVPYDGYREDLAARLNTIVVSHKPDHGLSPKTQANVHVTSGQLHEETAYGIVNEQIDGKQYNLVARKPIDALTCGEINRVRDAGLRAELQGVADEAERTGQKLHEALANFGRHRNIRRVRILKTEQSVRIVRHGAGFTKAYAPGGNHCVEIFELPNGEWSGQGITIFDANQPGYVPAWRSKHLDARLVMRVHNGDLIEADFGGGRRIARVYRLEPSANRLRLAGHNEAGSLDNRHKDPNDPLRWIFGSWTTLKKGQARRVRVDMLGRVAAVEDRL